MIRKTIIGLITTLMLVCFTRVGLAQGNLVINGGFDTDTSGWTISNVSNIGGYSSSFGDPAGSVFLFNPSLPPVPTASQEINSLNPGSLYVISGDYLGGGKDTVDNGFGVALDGVFLFETVAPPTRTNWYSFSFEYTPASTSALLSLSSQINGTDDQYYIDNISIVIAPEPPAVSLLFLGSGVFIYVRRTYKRQFHS